MNGPHKTSDLNVIRCSVCLQERVLKDHLLRLLFYWLIHIFNSTSQPLNIRHTSFRPFPLSLPLLGIKSVSPVPSGKTPLR